jgi:hypothetical protein
LVAEEHHTSVGKGVTDGIQCLIHDRFGEIDAVNFCSDRPSDKATYAAYMLANKVSPPDGGTSRA